MMPEKSEWAMLNIFQLKLIALFAMLADHVGKMFFPQQVAFQLVGRFAFPVFSWLIANGYWHTRSVKWYLGRLLIFALLSQIPFALFTLVTLQGRDFSTNPLDYLTSLNVLFTLFLGLAGIVCYEKVSNKGLGWCIVLLLAGLGALLRVDYGMVGVLSVCCFHIFRNQYRKLLVVQSLLFLLLYFLLFFENLRLFTIFLAIIFAFFASLALFLIKLYDGKLGPKAGYLFYGFYPGHILAIYVIHLLLLVSHGLELAS